MTYASSGAGTTIHLAGEMFNDAVKVKMVHVPFPGSGPAVTAMLGNQASVMFDDLPSSMPHVKSGALRTIAVTGAKRSPQLPYLPTLKEVGVPYNLGNFEVSAWFALCPARVSRPPPSQTASWRSTTFAGVAVEALRKGTRAFSHLIRLCGRRDRSQRGTHRAQDHPNVCLRRLLSVRSCARGHLKTGTDFSELRLLMERSPSGRTRFGAAGGDRTHDPRLRRPILYPLSYSRKSSPL